MLTTEIKISNKTSLSYLILTLFSLLLGGAVLYAFLLDQLGVPVRPWSVGLALGVTGLFFLRNKSNIKVDKAELLVFGFIVLAVLAYCFWLGMPDQLPVGTTVDAVHQEGLADYINQSGQLPIKATQLRANLMDGIEYPPAFVILVSLASQFTGIDPLYLFHPIASLCLALALGTTFLLLCALFQSSRWRIPLAALATGCCLLPFGYTFGSFTNQTYYAQVTGNCFLMLALYFLVHWHRKRQRETLVIFGLLSSALIICYPTYFVLPFFSVVITEMLAFRVKLRQRISSILWLSVPLGLILFLFLRNRLLIGLDTLSNEGAVLPPDVNYFGWLILALAAVGVVIGLFSREASHKLAVLFCTLAVAEGFGLWLLKLVSSKGSTYAIFKQFYLSSYLIPVLAAIGLNGLLLILTRKNLENKNMWAGGGVLGIVLFGSFLGTTWLTHPQAERPFPVFTRDIMEVAYWTRDHLKPKEYDITYNTLPGTIPYWLDVGIFKFPRNQHALDLLNGAATNFDSWLNQLESAQYFFTDNVAPLKGNNAVTVLYQSGNVAVLTRSAAYKAQAAERTKISLQYKAELKGNQLELRTEAALSKEPAKWLSVGLGIEYANRGEWVFSAFAPVEEGRISRPQYLGTVVELPSLQIKELYVNNTFPPKPPTKAVLEPGHYISYLLLKKRDTLVEKIPLIEFDLLNENQVKPDPNKQSFSGYLLYEDSESQFEVGDTAPISLEATPDFSLKVQPLPEKFKSGEKATLLANWAVAKETLLNYQIRWLWLDANQQIAGDYTSSPADGRYPTWLWAPNTNINLRHEIPVPEKPGKYQLAIVLVEPNTVSEPTATPLNSFITVFADSDSQ